MFFIHKKRSPKDQFKDVTYGKINCSYIVEQKEGENQARLAIGRDRINYPGDCGTHTAYLLIVKLLSNSVLPASGTEFMTLNIKNFYLCALLERYEYLQMKLISFPEDIIKLYKLQEKVIADGCVNVEVGLGMYELSQLGLLAQQLLEKRLGAHGYTQSKYMPGFGHMNHDQYPPR